MNDLFDRGNLEITKFQKKHLNKIIDEFNIKHLLNKNFNSLSSGQKQLIILLITILNSPDVLLIDEPYNHLDLKYKVLFRKALEKIMNRTGNISYS